MSHPQSSNSVPKRNGWQLFLPQRLDSSKINGHRANPFLKVTLEKSGRQTIKPDQAVWPKREMTLPAYYSLVINNSQYCQSRVPPPLIHLSDQPAQPLQEGPEGLMLPLPTWVWRCREKKASSFLSPGSYDFGSTAELNSHINTFFVYKGGTAENRNLPSLYQ